MVMKFRANNGGLFGLLLLILLTGCDVAAPDDQYQLGPDSEIQLEVPMACSNGHGQPHPPQRVADHGGNIR
jgi:hypothetical protein